MLKSKQRNRMSAQNIQIIQRKENVYDNSLQG